MKRNKPISFLNIFSSMFLQLVTIISGFIIPRLILDTFGSEANGLISSLNQFLNYLTIVEGGVSAVVLANLYKPLASKNVEKTSKIIYTARRFYNKLATAFLLYSFVLSFVYPLLSNTTFSFEYVSTMTIILSIQIFVKYAFSLSLRLLLQADKKVYIVSFAQSLIIILEIIAFVTLRGRLNDLRLLELVCSGIFLLQPIIYHFAVSKYIPIDKSVDTIDKSLLKNKWDGLGVSIATFIHNNTDVVVLTLFTSLSVVSVYSIYAMVVGQLKRLIQSFSSGISPSLGHLYAKDDKAGMNKLFNVFEYITFFLTSFLFTVGGLLLTPFVLIYTSNVTDISYNEPLFGIIILLAEVVFCLKEPFVNLAYIANRFKTIRKHAIIEALINIVISVVLVNWLGIVGIAIGTLVAMSYRTIYHIVLAKIDLLHRPVKFFVRKLVVFGACSLICCLICLLFLPIQELSIRNWIIAAIEYSGIQLLLLFAVSFAFYRSELAFLKGNISRFLKKK